jgi:hypothetical protein
MNGADLLKEMDLIDEDILSLERTISNYQELIAMKKNRKKRLVEQVLGGMEIDETI